MKRIVLGLIIMFIFTSCSARNNEESAASKSSSAESVSMSSADKNISTSTVAESQPFTVNTAIPDVINYPSFGSWGRLIFPVNSGYYSGETLVALCRRVLTRCPYSEFPPNFTPTRDCPTVSDSARERLRKAG